MSKVWQITGIHDDEEFTAELVVDVGGDVSEAEHPLHEVLGLPWAMARSRLIDRGYHGQRIPSHIEGHSELRRRGWTPKQIEFLGEPDLIKPNPHGGLHPMRCYRIERIEAIEGQLGIKPKELTPEMA